MLKLFLAIASTILPALAQTASIAADYSGRVVVFESSSPLTGEKPGFRERILESVDGAVAVTFTSPFSVAGGGAAFPRTNDDGQLRAHSSYFAGSGPLPPRYTGFVRHVRDNWEVSLPGIAGLNRDGRYAVFSHHIPDRTTWVDLWTGGQTELTGVALNVASIADDGCPVAGGPRRLEIYCPGTTFREIPLQFEPSSAIIDRTARFTAAGSAGAEPGLWRIDLLTGQAEPWVERCGDCSLLDIGTYGDVLLYLRTNDLHLVRQPGSEPVRLNREYASVDSATLTGDGRSAIASTSDGLTRYDLKTLEEQTVLPGRTEFYTMRPILAPGMWVRQLGRGLAETRITLSGTPVDQVRQSSADIVWTVPADMRLGPAELQAAQLGSPFQPYQRTIEVQRAAPVILTQADAGTVFWPASALPLVLHTASGEIVSSENPARPGESVQVVMTGLSDQAENLLWSLLRFDGHLFDKPSFESTETHLSQPHWTVVRLKLPDTLPAGQCLLLTEYGRAQSSALLRTADR